MKPQNHEPILNDDDALSLWVGRVARAHAHLEYNVDNVHRFLARQVGYVPESNAVRGFDQLVNECRKMLQRSTADRDIATAGDTALIAAKVATAIRNRVVHDMWIPDPLKEGSEQPRWNTIRRSGDLQDSYSSATPRDLAVVVEAHTLLMRNRVRVSGLFMALHAVWPTDRTRGEGPTDPSNMARYVALMTDRFTLEANGDYDVS